MRKARTSALLSRCRSIVVIHTKHAAAEEPGEILVGERNCNVRLILRGGDGVKQLCRASVDVLLFWETRALATRNQPCTWPDGLDRTMDPPWVSQEGGGYALMRRDLGGSIRR